MDQTPAQRKLAFVVIVLALAGLGAFLLASRPPSARSAAGRPAASAPRASLPAASAPAAGPLPAPSSPPAGAAPVPSAVDIYRWLPFSRAGLAAAATQVLAFATDYATYRAGESARSYAGRMQGLVTPQLAAVLARGYAAPGVAQARVRQHHSATGRGQITGLRAFGPSSLTFTVLITQRVTGRGRTAQAPASYAVTVTGGGTHWLVSDIELASAGNT
jgi:hypothetical protein